MLGDKPQSPVAILGLGEACERAYDTGVEQVTVDDEELTQGLGVELTALIDAVGAQREGRFTVSKAIRTMRIAALAEGRHGQELVHRLETGVNSQRIAKGSTELWAPNCFSVNQYRVGDSIGPHSDSLMQGLLSRAMIRQGLVEESEETVAASEDVYLEFIQDVNRRNPYAHDYILQVLGKKTLKHWPGDKLYLPEMSQAELDEGVEIKTTPGDLTIVRKEILADDRFPVTHAVPPVLEDGMTLVVF